MLGTQEKRAGDRRRMGSLGKAFKVLEAFADGAKPMRLTELSRLSGVEQSATQRVLFTLRDVGYVRQDPDTKLYSLSPRMLMFGNTFLAADRVREVAAPILEAANVQCEETVNLSELDGPDVVYVLRYPSRHVVSVNLSVGSLLPAYCTAPGRAMLAHLDARAVDRILDRAPLRSLTPYTQTDPGRIRQILADVRRDGYCLSNQEAFLGDISISAPVFDARRRVAAAVNIAVPFPRWSVEKARETLTPLVAACAAQITAGMSGARGA